MLTALQNVCERQRNFFKDWTGKQKKFRHQLKRKSSPIKAIEQQAKGFFVALFRGVM
jgi:hypothetical protein